MPSSSGFSGASLCIRMSPSVCKRCQNFLKDTALGRAQTRVLLQSFTHTPKRRVASLCVLWVLRIKRAEQQVAVDLRGMCNAQERPLVVMKRFNLRRAGAEVFKRMTNGILAIPPQPFLLVLLGHVDSLFRSLRGSRSLDGWALLLAAITLSRRRRAARRADEASSSAATALVVSAARSVGVRRGRAQPDLRAHPRDVAEPLARASSPPRETISVRLFVQLRQDLRKSRIAFVDIPLNERLKDVALERIVQRCRLRRPESPVPRLWQTGQRSLGGYVLIEQPWRRT